MKWILRSAFVLGVAALAAGIALGSGTTTITQEKHSTINKLTFDWLSTSGGAVDTTYGKQVTGDLLGIILVPDAEPAAPLDNYDVSFLNQYGAPIMVAAANCDSATVLSLSARKVANECMPLANDKVRIVVSNAGSANSGQVIVYYR